MRNKLLQLFIFLLFELLCSTHIMGQNDFNIIRVDNFEFPQIKVFIQTENDKASVDDFIVEELGNNVDFELDTMPSSSITNENVLFFLFNSFQTKDSADIFKRQMQKSYQFLNKNNKINIGFLIGNDSVKCKVNYFSAEFSQDIDYFKKNIDTYIGVSSQKCKTKNCNKLLEILDFINSRNNIPEKKAIIIFSPEILPNEKNFTCLQKIIQKEIPVYFMVYDTISPSYEKKLVAVSSETGGIYTKVKISEISNTLKKYIEDASLQMQENKSNVFVIKFKTSQIKTKNSADLIFKGNKKQFNYFTKESYIFERRLYIALIVLLVLSTVLFFSVLRINKSKINLKKRLLSYKNLQNKRNKSQSSKIENDFASIMVSYKNISKKYNISQKGIIIGRKNECDIVIPESTVSGFHASINKIKKSYIIEDLDSTNGTILNGKSIKKAEIFNNDVIKIGVAVITFNNEN